MSTHSTARRIAPPALDAIDTRGGAAPRAKRQRAERVVHGMTLVDDYAWLRADNWREVMRKPRSLAPEIRAYLEAENAYGKAWLAPLSGLRRRLYKEMRGRIKEDDSTVPSPDGPWAYYYKYRPGGEHPSICRRPREDADDKREVVMLDGDLLAKGKSYFQFGDAAHSPSHRLLAWSIDDKGSELHVVRVRDLATGADLPDEIPDTTGEVVWTKDETALYYVRLDDEHRPRQIYRHVLGTPPGRDMLVYEEKDIGFFVDLGETQSGAFAVIDCHDHETSEVYLLDLGDPVAKPRLVAAREVNVAYEVDHLGDRLIILTNADGAEDFKLVEAPLAEPERRTWRDLVPHVPGRYILEHAALKDWILRFEREDGLPRIVARHVATGHEHAIAFDEEAYALGLNVGYEFDTDVIRFAYSSMTTPTETHDYDLRTRQRVLRKRQEIPSGHDPKRYVTRRLQAVAHDGEMIPVSLLMRAETPMDGSHPVLLYGYGAYGSAISAGFRVAPLSLVDRGFVYAIAHVRGGTEKGRRWYKDGKLSKKTNTFNDFLSAAEHLIAQGYTARGRIVAHGVSAGGMLMGAIANMRPDLFAGIIADVPFVDVITTMLDDSLPLTPPEWPEWGNPLKDAAALEAMLGYSPYDNVAEKAYPAIFALGGLTDPRVTYWEPAKWVAKLRAHSTSSAPILLHTNMKAGHGGVSGRFQSLRETAMIHAFALEVVGLSRTRLRHSAVKAQAPVALTR